ncbi:MAG: hypothetical protein LBD60_01400 [Puniceicoccales bacterium]|jgi:hypothetical protein|nr:hypothetical protein [Puniceicoccales bacterium]
MVKRRLIEIVVCSALLIGNCVASQVVAPEIISWSDLETQLMTLQGELPVVQQGDSQGEDNMLTNLEAQVSLICKGSDVRRSEEFAEDEIQNLEAGLKLIEKGLSEWPKVNTLKVLSSEAREILREQRALLLQQQGILRQQITVIRQMAQMQQQTQAERQGEGRERENEAIFTSWSQWQAILDQFRNRAITVDRLRSYIDAARNYYLSDQNIRIPGSVPKEVWRKAKVVEMLHRIARYLPNTKIAERCLQEIRPYTGNDDSLERFEYMKLLLLSQSGIWEDGKYILNAEADPMIVREAIAKLCNIAEDPEEEVDVVNGVKNFLRSLHQQGGFENFFPPNYLR